MAAGFEVRGSHDLAVMAKRLKDAGEKDLRLQLLRGVRKSAEKAIPDVQESARELLPHTGGLNELVADRDYKARARYTGFGALVRIVGTGMRQLQLINSGAVRHKVFGEWVAGVEPQEVPTGYFTDPLLKRRPEFLRDIEQVLHDVARQITRRF